MDNNEKHQLSCEDARAFIGKSHTGFAKVNADYKFVYVNPAYCKILDAPPEKIIGTRFEEWTHPDYIGIDENLAAQVKAGEIPGYTLNKPYLRAGLYNQKRREIWGLLQVEGHFSTDGKFEYYRVQFRAYDDLSNRPPLDLRESVTWICKNWRLVGTILAILIASIFGSSEQVSMLLKVLTGSENGGPGP